jgi:sulfoxide reductase heme-binding subunit YedZ
MAAALSIGPLTVRRTGAAPLNNYLRRDIGIWSGLTGLVHFFAGVDQSMKPVYLARYVETTGGMVSAELGRQLFTWGSLAGLVVFLLVLLLLGLSSDRALRRLGAKWWKRLQRSAYWAFAFTVGHGLAFQLLESRNSFLISVLVGVVLIVLGLQYSGNAAYRRGAAMGRSAYPPPKR